MATFVPVDLSGHLNAGRTNEPLRAGSPPPWHTAIVECIAAMPTGDRTFWGIPFAIPPASPQSPSLLVLDEGPVSLPIAARADYIVLAHFCNASRDATSPDQPRDATVGMVFRIGEHLADYVIEYEDEGSDEHRQSIRRRFEVNEPALRWGHRAFAAQSSHELGSVDFNGPYPAHSWGWYQTGIGGTDNESGEYWLYALANPQPERRIARLRLEPTGADRIAVAAVTLYSGPEHPLRRRALESLRVTLPEAACLPDVETTIDLGTLVRKYAVPAFAPEAWLAEPLQGWGEEPLPIEPATSFILDASANPGATLSVAGSVVPLEGVFAEGAATSADGRVRVEMLTPRRNWVHVTIEDAQGRPTPARVHFRAPDGRYLPPYGHRHQVNTNWFEDYGADLKLGHTQYAYVDGRFQIELPVGDVYVEVSKGFEYRPLRRRLTILPGQRELSLRLERPIDRRSAGWVTADTHVHFISPQTAWLEAQGEGVNLVNLLASQWGELYTSFGDLTGAASGVSTNDTVIWVGTENRQHILGHISLLGTQGIPVCPMCASGADEAAIGDPLWSSLAEWADLAREREGLVVVPHFPDPYCEVAADIVLEKVDGVELKYFTPNLDSFHIREWYRYLNCGYRLAAVGGTDKMWAGMPVGGIRTYADLQGADLSFATWSAAVRAGRTFTTSGPIIGLSVEGRAPGDEVRLSRGGTLAVEALAESVLPFHTLQVIVNGQVVAEEAREADAHRLVVRTNVKVPASSWVAARCISRYTTWQGWPINVAAHTSPVYVVVGGERQFSPEDATFMMTLMDGGLAWVDTLSVPADAERQRKVRRVFEQAKEALHRRLHAEGHGHQH
ncbi:MAG: CehA/McbA family metallohydrolase [Anaerolineae bacterium]